MRRASLSFFLLAPALCAWFLWPRGVSSAPALAPPVEEVDDARGRMQITPSEVEIPEDQDAARVGFQSAPTTPPAPAAPPPHPPTTSAFGILEGSVVRQSRQALLPIAAAQVTLHPARDRNDPRSNSDFPQLASTYTAADGTFRFTDLPPGRYGVVALDLTAEREAIVFVGRSPPIARATLVFGSSRVYGTVRDVRGKPLSHCTLQLESDQTSTSAAGDSSLLAVSKTTADGRYAFEALPAGHYRIELSGPQGDWKTGWPGRIWEFDLLEGQELRLNAGPRQGAAHWRGIVRSRTGEALDSYGKLDLVCQERDLAGGLVSIRVRVRYSNTGAFDAVLDPGTWTPIAEPDSKAKSKPVVEPGIVDPEGLRQDIILP